jgi:hypothetical protein
MVLRIIISLSLFASFLQAGDLEQGAASAQVAVQSTNLNSPLEIPAKLIQGMKSQEAKATPSTEWQLGYYFEAWLQSAIYFQAFKSQLSPDELMSYETTVQLFGKKFREAQKELNISDADLFLRLQKKDTIPQTFATLWPPPA